MTAVRFVVAQFPFTIMLNKILFAACALFVVAHATDIYVASYAGTDTTCTSTIVAQKVTLDQCTNTGSPMRSKWSLSGSTYTWNGYGTTDTTCAATPSITISGAADTCVTGTVGTKFFPTATDYVSGAANSADCTSGTCTLVSGNSACKCSSVMSVLLSMRIDSCVSCS